MESPKKSLKRRASTAFTEFENIVVETMENGVLIVKRDMLTCGRCTSDESDFSGSDCDDCDDAASDASFEEFCRETGEFGDLFTVESEFAELCIGEHHYDDECSKIKTA
jgi:hypothetical protein